MIPTSISSQEAVTLLVGVIAPLLVGLVTKSSWGGDVRAVVLLAISVASGVGQGFLDQSPSQPWSWQVATVSGTLTFVIAVATHFGLWKPIGLSDLFKRIGVKDPVTVPLAPVLDGVPSITSLPAAAVVAPVTVSTPTAPVAIPLDTPPATDGAVVAQPGTVTA